MRINTNVSSLTAQEAAQNTNKSIKNSLEKLSSGLKINKASDDASGLAIADKLRTQSTSLNQGVSNGNSAVTLLQIADKSMAEQSNILDIVKSKLIQANTSTTSDDGRESIRKDIVKLLEQLDNIAKQTNYNGTTLLQNGYDDQNSSSSLTFQIGESADDIISSVAIRSNTLGLGGGTDDIVETSGASDRNNLVANGNSMIITTDGTNTAVIDTSAASGGAAADVNLSGQIGTLTMTGTSGTISGLDANTSAILSAYAADIDGTSGSETHTLSNGTSVTVTVTGTLTENTDGTFSLSSSGSITFGSTYSVASMNVKESNASGTISVGGSTAATKLTVTNNTGEELKIESSGTMTGGQTLSGLKSLNSGELTREKADEFQSVVDAAITRLNDFRGDIGSTQNQVESAVRNLMTQATNVKAAESIIRDVDYAEESANFNKQNIISQAGSYAISQANNVQQNVLRLLQ